MQPNRKFIAVALIALMLLTVPGLAARLGSKSFLATADGHGTLKVGQTEFTISAVVVKLLEDGKAEIILVTDITVFVSGTWSGGDDLMKGIQLKITGGTTAGGLEGTGEVFLRNEGKSVVSLTLQGTNKLTKRNIAVNFVAK